MAFNQLSLQNLSLDSPKLKPLNYGMLSKLSNSQLRINLASEKQELAQLQTALSKASSSSGGGGGISSSSSANLTERQQLVREIQAVRAAKQSAAAQLIRLQSGKNIDATSKIGKTMTKLDKRVERERKEAERTRKKAERERKRLERAIKKGEKIAEKKRKFEEKGIKKGSTAGGRAHDRIQRFFNSSKWSSSDKDRIRELLDDIGVYEGDEVFQILTLLESGAFDSVKEAEDFLNGYQNDRGKQTAIQKMEERKNSNIMESQNEEILTYEGPGIHMTF